MFAVEASVDVAEVEQRLQKQCSDTKQQKRKTHLGSEEEGRAFAAMRSAGCGFGARGGDEVATADLKGGYDGEEEPRDQQERRGETCKLQGDVKIERNQSTLRRYPTQQKRTGEAGDPK